MDKRIMLIIVILSLIAVAGCTKENPNAFMFENEYQVFVSQDGYELKGFIGETPLNLKLRADPRDIKDIPSEDGIKSKLLPASLIYITLKPNLTSVSVIAAREISKITGHQYLFRTTTLGALTEESGNSDAPIITCADATKEQKVVHLRLSDTTKISSLNNCITIDGQTEWDLIRAADKLVLQLLEIL